MAELNLETELKNLAKIQTERDEVSNKIKLFYKNEMPHYKKALDEYDKISKLVDKLEDTYDVNFKANTETLIKQLYLVVTLSVNETISLKKEIDRLKEQPQSMISTSNFTLSGRPYEEIMRMSDADEIRESIKAEMSESM